MQCPLCGEEMARGAIVISGLRSTAQWVREEEARSPSKGKGLRVGKPNLLGDRLLLEHAYFCRSCRKIVGLFDAGA